MTLCLNKESTYLLRGLLLLFVLVLLAMRLIDGGLQTASAAHGIVSFEFCAFSSSCAQQLQDWAIRGQQLAMLSLGLDYLFMLLYAGLLWLALMHQAPRQPVALQGLTRLAAYLAVAAGLADALENYALIQLLLSRSIEPYADFAAMCASIKFGLLAFSLGWLLFCAARGGYGKLRHA